MASNQIDCPETRDKGEGFSDDGGWRGDAERSTGKPTTGGIDGKSALKGLPPVSRWFGVSNATCAPQTTRIYAIAFSESHPTSAGSIRFLHVHKLIQICQAVAPETVHHFRGLTGQYTDPDKE